MGTVLRFPVERLSPPAPKCARACDTSDGATGAEVVILPAVRVERIGEAGACASQTDCRPSTQAGGRGQTRP
ncbi:hypothetical protein [Blastochloris sulfoviridis]|uniref:Uncharacterized protein n=1 Tax=Blastochloris sulfoviridis TaxID=50712 RepID=A0A5M6I3Q7_9HYPH|nr:hypothetical protein [Blastochloris sulfoviridis]KAA5602844.1 hypothetical protein F1193_03120 [Blastochloris sulfoviridis]